MPEPPSLSGSSSTTPPDLAPGDAIPATYHPLADLSREPELVSEVDQDKWPSLPDTPAGTFQLELAVGADGSVNIVVPHCDPALCAAAQTYAGIVGRWHFQPAEIFGLPVPSRLRLEFEVGIAPAPRPSEDQAPRQ